MILAKDVVNRVVKKFGIPEASALKMTLDCLEKVVQQEAEKYLVKAEFYGLEFKDVLRLRTELTTPTPVAQDLSKVPVLKK